MGRKRMGTLAGGPGPRGSSGVAEERAADTARNTRSLRAEEAIKRLIVGLLLPLGDSKATESLISRPQVYKCRVSGRPSSTVNSEFQADPVTAWRENAAHCSSN